jgi:transposase
MLHLSPSCAYFLYREPCDMRRGFDSLCGLVQSAMNLSALSGNVFIFLNRRRNQVKLLLWEADGFAIYHKRLEQGTYELPACTPENSTVAITCQQLHFILQGVALQKVHYRHRYKKTA